MIGAKPIGQARKGQPQFAVAGRLCLGYKRARRQKVRRMKFLLQILTWWNGQTLGTRIFTWRRGTRVGEDADGNVYYQSRDGANRWVIYNGLSEASRVSPEWHGWLHHTYQSPPTEAPLVRKAWEKPHQENLTGSALAYAPAGSLRHAQPAKRQDYDAWAPE